jgi:4-aminobutyrate aminotransferase
MIGDVRGKGLMIGTEFVKANGEPDAKTAKAVRQACQENNLLLLTCGPYGNVIRWIPPLMIDEGQIDEGLGVFTSVLEKVAAH